MKKDKDDQEGLLFAFFPEFKKQMENASMLEILKVGNAIASADKTLHCVFVNKVRYVHNIPCCSTRIGFLDVWILIEIF